MDDTNQNNRPLDQGSTSPLPPTPPITPPVSPVAPVEDITPAEPTTTFSTTVTTPTPAPQPKTEWDLPEPTTPVTPVPETTTFTTTVSTPAPEPAFVPPQMTPPAPEVTPLPTPPVTEPMAPPAKPKGKISPIVGGMVALLFVVGIAGSAYYVSNQLSTRQAVVPTAPESEPQAMQETTHNYVKICTRKYSGDGVCTKAIGTKTCKAASGSRKDKWKMGACGTYDCGAGKQRLVASNCAGSTKTFYYAQCETNSACISTDVKKKEEPVITFERPGWISVAFSGVVKKITLEPVAGGTPIVITNSTDSAQIREKIFETKTLAEKYKITVRGGNETKDSYGFRLPLDAEETKCGQEDPKYGGISGISVGKQAAEAKMTLDDVLPGSVQCWGDAEIGDITQDYDFNDFQIYFGYANEQSGACMGMSIYKKVNGVYGTTALTTSELQTLKVGDVLKFTSTANTDNLKARFGITIGNGTVSWTDGVIDATDKKLFTLSDYTIQSADSYRFEAQVSTAP